MQNTNLISLHTENEYIFVRYRRNIIFLDRLL
jgi:hypothetical protein